MIYIQTFDYSGITHGERKRLETLNGRLLLKRAVMREYGVDINTLAIETGQHGKPYFTDSSINFNISHSGNYVAAAVGDCPLGIDVQVVRSVKDRLANKLCNYNEKEFIAHSPDRNKAFITLWALKESYIKAIGKGMSYPMNKINFDIGQFSEMLSGSFSNREGEYLVRDYGDFVLAVCALGKFDFTVTDICMNEKTAFLKHDKS